MNKKEITATTRTIEVKIAAEADFNPQNDIDVSSLRFGSYTEVNFGRGTKPIRTKKSGNDLIVIFSGKGSGITADEFAPKMIGRDKRGNLIYGYARLPYVNYKPAILSALRPVYDHQQKILTVEVQNFGLSASKKTEVVVFAEGKEVFRKRLQPVSPYDKVILKGDNIEISSDKVSYKVLFIENDKVVDKNEFGNI